VPLFSLVDDPWLTVRLRGSGALAEVGLLDALLRAGEIEDLVVDLPTQKPAIMRQVLLPVVLDALGPPADRREWGRRFGEGGFTADEREKLRGYLAEHQPRFGLFDPDAPFAQVADLHTATGETKSSASLVATEATGNNVPLFAARTEGEPPPLTPAQAARWLLHAHCWDTAAIKTGAVGDPNVKAGKTTGNHTGPLGQLGVVMPTGRNLYETLLLNLPIGSPATSGTPQWRRDPAGPTWQTRMPDGLLDLWTWQSRRIRLIPEETPEGVRVTRVVLCAGDRLSQVPEWEPHTTWEFVKAAKSRTGTERRPGRHNAGKAIWRGLNALLATEPEENDKDPVETSELLRQLRDLEMAGVVADDYPLRLETFGVVYGNQSAVVEDVIHDEIPLPVSALRADSEAYGILLEVTRQADGLAQAVNRLSADLRRAIGADPIPWDKGQRPGEVVLHLLDPLVRRLLAGIRDSAGGGERLDRGQLAWEELAWRRTREVADRLFGTLPASAFAGREVERNGRTSTYRPATAEYAFRRQLREILPRAAGTRKPGQAA
jgi:CRISPR system Cascade subunit CasA